MKHDTALDMIEKVMGVLSSTSAMLVQLHDLLLSERRAAPSSPAPKPEVAPPVTWARTARLYDLVGEKLTLRQLAERAGCSIAAMDWRLKGGLHSVEAAVAMGAADLARRKVLKAEARTPRIDGPQPKRYTLGDEQLTADQLSQRAGCKRSTMYKRLQTLTPAEAVAWGRCWKPAMRAAEPTAAPVPTVFPPSVFDVPKPPAPPVATSPRVTVPPPAPKQRAPKQAKPEPWRAPITAPKPAAMGPVPSPAAFTPKQEPVYPPGVKRTVAPTPRGRFEVDEVEPVFARLGPGRYLGDEAR